ncbi:MAG: ABC transporter ATP-binding protein [Erysipelotrichaceae bacterium]|nr:ABC transporter ATP-binding protein [Erysipelotrichaceae bacterium]
MMIELRSAVRIYSSGRGEVRALERVNLKIRAGEFLAVLGPSGCGKSTLLNVLAGYERLDEGEYLWFGRRGQDVMKDIRRSSAMIFQDHQLLEYLNVRDNLLLPSVYDHQKISRQRLDDVCRSLGIERLLRRYGSELSGGEKQRCGIARAVLYDKRLLLADEPTGSLDRENGEAIMKIFQQLNAQGHTVVMVTHDQHMASAAERIIRMEDGHVVS